jgi:hypothetical protein
MVDVSTNTGRPRHQDKMRCAVAVVAVLCQFDHVEGKQLLGYFWGALIWVCSTQWLQHHEAGLSRMCTAMPHVHTRWHMGPACTPEQCSAHLAGTGAGTAVTRAAAVC